MAWAVYACTTELSDLSKAIRQGRGASMTEGRGEGGSVDFNKSNSTFATCPFDSLTVIFSQQHVLHKCAPPCFLDFSKAIRQEVEGGEVEGGREGRLQLE